MPTVDIDIGDSAEVFAGEDKIFRFTVRDAANAVVDITTWTMEFDVRISKYTGQAAVIHKQSGSGLAITNGPGGQLEVSLASADTVGLKAGTYWYGLARTNAGAWDVNAQGQFVLQKAAVRAP